MLKTILVPAMGFPSDAAALETAYLVGRMFQGHLDCLHLRAEWARFAAATVAEDVAGAVADGFLAAFETESKNMRWRANRHFAQLCRRYNLPLATAPGTVSGMSAAFAEATGAPDDIVIAQARFHDLVVLSRMPTDFGTYGIDLGAVLFGAGRPVLIAPHRAPENLAPTIAIAWKETAEAARAVAAAMPLLAKADRIAVLTADEGNAAASSASAERVAEHLAWHGIAAEARVLDPSGRPAAETLVRAAEDFGAQMLVMGGYGRTRLGELLFGGVTRDILRGCRLPAFLCH